MWNVFGRSLFFLRRRRCAQNWAGPRVNAEGRRKGRKNVHMNLFCEKSRKKTRMKAILMRWVLRLIRRENINDCKLVLNHRHKLVNQERWQGHKPRNHAFFFKYWMMEFNTRMPERVRMTHCAGKKNDVFFSMSEAVTY